MVSSLKEAEENMGRTLEYCQVSWCIIHAVIATRTAVNANQL